MKKLEKKPKLKQRIYQTLDKVFAALGHRRKHPWPDAKDLDYSKYARAVSGAARFCYWNPWGWLPWAGIVVRYRYRSH